MKMRVVERKAARACCEREGERREARGIGWRGGRARHGNLSARELARQKGRGVARSNAITSEIRSRAYPINRCSSRFLDGGVPFPCSGQKSRPPSRRSTRRATRHRSCENHSRRIEFLVSSRGRTFPRICPCPLFARHSYAALHRNGAFSESRVENQEARL